MKSSFCLVLTALLALCARTTQAMTCVSNLPASNPDSAYTVHGDGTVTDKQTGLMWKQCAEGQTWSNGTCTGAASTHTWFGALALAESAVFANQYDWRLPNLKELRSLVEECRVDPSINDTVFPGTPNSIFWSGSPYENNGLDAWGTEFGDGYATTQYQSNTYHVRLVRSGQPSGIVALTVSKQGAGLGTVASTPVGINCGNSCSSYFPGGASVTLGAMPMPGAGSRFVKWGGACGGTQLTCTLTMDAAKSVTAEFSRISNIVPILNQLLD